MLQFFFTIIIYTKCCQDLECCRIEIRYKFIGGKTLAVYILALHPYSLSKDMRKSTQNRYNYTDLNSNLPKMQSFLQSLLHVKAKQSNTFCLKYTREKYFTYLIILEKRLDNYKKSVLIVFNRKSVSNVIINWVILRVSQHL